MHTVQRDCQKRFGQVGSQLGQLRWLLYLPNGLHKSGAETPLPCPPSKAFKVYIYIYIYIYVEEHLASFTFLMKMIIHLREMATVSQILIFLSNIPKDDIIHNTVTSIL